MKKFKLLILLVCIYSGVLSQIPNSLYFMRGVPQVYQINPAFQPDCKFFFGVPGIAPMQAKVQNSPFALNDVLYYNEELDSLITFLHPLGNKEQFLELLNERNYLDADVSTGLFSLGFRLNKSFLTIDVSTRVNARMSYPDDYLRLPIIGPDSGRFYDFNGFGIDASVFTEIAAGLSRKFGDKLTLGARAKVFLGMANVRTEKFDVTFASGETSWPLHTDISISSSSPYLTDYIKFAALAPIDLIFGDLDSMDIENPDVSEFREMALNPKNFGLGVDLGADYRLNDRIRISASIIDLGRIRWKSGVMNLSNKADYNFEGVDYNLGQDNDFFEAFSDSLKNTFNKFSAEKTAYSTWFPAKIYAGAAFFVHPKISLGLLSRTDFYKGDVKQQFTASANLYPIRMLSATFSYSVIDRYYKNIGAGLALKLSPLNIYIISDTGASSAMWWNEAKYFNLRLGMNFMFGRGSDQVKKKKGKVNPANYDLPLI